MVYIYVLYNYMHVYILHVVCILLCVCVYMCTPVRKNGLAECCEFKLSINQSIEILFTNQTTSAFTRRSTHRGKFNTSMVKKIKAIENYSA